MSTLAKKLNASLNLASKIAVVAGGSQGIGAGVAVRLAQAGSSVIILGRNEQLLNKTVAECKQAYKGEASATFDFIKADLSTVAGMKQAVQDIENKTNGKVDYLVQTQGGPPNGEWKENSEGIEMRFAVQILSHFALDYLLAKSGVLKEASITVCAPGGSFTEFDVEDIECRKVKGSGRLTVLMTMAKRAGLMTDSYQQALSRKFPNINFYHVFPGIVATNGAYNSGFPFPIPQLFSLASPILARTVGNSIQSYADIPVLLIANESSEKKEIVQKEGHTLNQNLKNIPPCPWAQDTEHQDQIFERLKGYF